MSRLMTGLSLLLLFSYCGQLQQVQIKPSPANAIPALHVTVDTGIIDIKISKLDIGVQVTGSISTTTFDMTFYNPLDRVLQGELSFPLIDGQTIVRYSLDINGQLREGVVVEKAKARVAFENTVRKGIDPGLVEKTRGNNFRTRIYPIPAKGYKRVVIGVEQKLEEAGEALLYQLPLEAKEAIDTFSITGTVKSTGKPVLQNNFFSSFVFNFLDNKYAGRYQKKSFSGHQVFAFSIPFKQDVPVVYTETRKGKTYFYLNSRINAIAGKKGRPSTIGLLWDVSGSAEERAKEKELELIDNYISASGDVKVVLIPFAISAGVPQEFTDKAALMDKLKSFIPDGGTQLGALNLTRYKVDEFLLFSDGLSTFGKKDMALTDKPVITITSSASSDFSYLKFIAKETGGKFIDLTKADVVAAVKEMGRTDVQIGDVKTTAGAIESYVTEIDPLTNSFSMAGILASPDAYISVSFDAEGQEPTTEEYSIAPNEMIETEGIGSVWASMKINNLDLQFEKTKKKLQHWEKNFP